MKIVLRNRTDIAACMALVARNAEYKINDIHKVARKANRRLNLNEQAQCDELMEIKEHYRQESNRHITTAILCGNPVAVVRLM